MAQKGKKLGRRGFLQIVAAVGTAGVATKVGLNISHAPVVVNKTQVLMGTVVNLTVVGENRRKAERAVEACYRRMEGLEKILSRFRPGSQLSQLNLNGELSNAHPVLQLLLETSFHIAERSGGAFDISVKPLSDLYASFQQEEQGVPPQNEIEEALTKVDYRQVRWSGERVWFSQPGMSITLDGIAKGFIVDRGVEVLKGWGFGNVLVEAGGDLVASGIKNKGSTWKVGIQSPREREEGILADFPLSESAAATSGDYLQSFTSDLQHHHILDPRKGYSSPGLASATIIAPTGTLADAMATAVMVLGRKEGLRWLEETPGVEGYLVTKSMENVCTKNFPANYQL